MSASLNDRLAAYFQARPHVWIDGKDLALVAGGYGWRTRCSDLRKRGMTIENRQRRIAQRVISEYRWVPTPTAAPRAPHNLNQPWGLR